MAAALTGPVTADTILDDLMATYRVTIPLFIHRKLMCIGCPIARMHDVRQACSEHGIPLSEFLQDINETISDGRSPYDDGEEVEGE
ncbi:MAG: DUF1858 domain-containing protein [Pannonibacter sp.]|jgi:hybrid cluster-associated redox disulfide protein